MGDDNAGVVAMEEDFSMTRGATGVLVVVVVEGDDDDDDDSSSMTPSDGLSPLCLGAIGVAKVEGDLDLEEGSSLKDCNQLSPDEEDEEEEEDF
jgi:hypothetical protein